MVDWDIIKFDAEDVMKSLVGGWGEPLFPFEREIQLFQFQTWIYMPDPKSMVRYAGVLACAKILQQLGRKYSRPRGPGQNSADRLALCLQDETYASLYTHGFNKAGGWTRLIDVPAARDFVADLSKRKADNEAVFEMMDYRFRHLDHGGAPKLANLSTGIFSVERQRASNK